VTKDGSTITGDCLAELDASHRAALLLRDSSFASLFLRSSRASGGTGMYAKLGGITNPSDQEVNANERNGVCDVRSKPQGMAAQTLS
jgi:hypothetical protein